MDIIISPIITEKSMKDAGEGKFTFEVIKEAHKDEIKKTVERNFNVHVVNISTSIRKGRSMRSGVRRTEKKLKDIKKAIVTLKKGEKIGLFELGGEEKK